MNKEIKTLLKNATDTKEKLILLALNSYLEEGAHHTNFQTLANQLDISQAAIYKHFKNKEDLLVQAINYAAIKGREYIDASERSNDQALDRLKLYIKSNLDFCVEQRVYSIAVITLHYFAACVPEVKSLHADINLRRIKKIETFLIHAQHESLIGPIKTLETAQLIHSILLGEMIKCFLWPDELTINQRIKKIWPYILSLLSTPSV